MTEVERALQRSCAAAFQIINTAVILYQGPYAAGSAILLDDAKSLLIRARIIDASEFENVSVRWARLTDAGQAPDRNIVLISENYLNDKNLFGAASTLAHEMIHIRQYRRLGTDNFKCQYSRMFISAPKQDESHPLEKEAYDFEAQHGQAIWEMVNVMNREYLMKTPPGFPAGGSACYTSTSSCPLQFYVRVGGVCQCLSGQTFIPGTAR